MAITASRDVAEFDCVCDKCGYVWTAKGPDPPVRCASKTCRSPYWGSQVSVVDGPGVEAGRPVTPSAGQSTEKVHSDPGAPAVAPASTKPLPPGVVLGSAVPAPADAPHHPGCPCSKCHPPAAREARAKARPKNAYGPKAGKLNKSKQCQHGFMVGAPCSRCPNGEAKPQAKKE